MLTGSGIVRSDIRWSFGPSSGIAAGVPLTIELTVTDSGNGGVANLARTSLNSDNVFRDGYSTQLATVTGSVSNGLIAALTVPVAA